MKEVNINMKQKTGTFSLAAMWKGIKKDSRQRGK